MLNALAAHLPIMGNYLADFAVAALVAIAGLLVAIMMNNRLGWVVLTAGGLWIFLVGSVLLHAK